MNYYIDTEFLEGPQKRTFCGIEIGATKPTIDLISIGIVAEDGREYYAISKDFNLKEAWNRFDIAEQTPYEKQNGYSGRKVYWIRENVLKTIWRELYQKGYGVMFQIEIMSGAYDSQFNYKSLKSLIIRYGKSNKQIADEVKEFCMFSSKLNEYTGITWHFEQSNIQFYAYFADYDWVAFCWLFGKMMDLPSGFPMYCKDLKQELDNNAMKMNLLTNELNFPKQENEHNALADARWNKKLHEFIKSL